MRREKALRTALKIMEICKKHGEQDRCKQCPFYINGCIVSDGSAIPVDWPIVDLVVTLEINQKG